MSRLRDERGFTLPELLTTMSMAIIVLLGAFGLLDVVMKRTTETRLRIETTQAGRTGMDTITRQLRSQVCLNATTPAVAAASPTSVTFYADLSDGTGGPETRVEKRVLTYDATAKRITEAVYRPGGTAAAITYPGTATRTRTLLTNVEPVGSESIFRYYAYTAATPTTPPALTQELINPTSATDLGRIARVDLHFTVKIKAGTVAQSSFALRDQVYVRAANPNDPAPYPTCA